ncbi:hypothetical protein [Streptomyces sp. NBC_00572]|uniref:hypothetical protein n=1 Tax=Streptomyces sp. NBC_00572 TaxID=2903664 RepID=UPI00224DA750|nr:hypothetical protein [Streptomyces sp. NBC_00572]MCX4984402.1 hypothetical protein [Streptomyces sp. NBC_00572]
MRSLAYDTAFRARARRTQGWGLGLLTLAALLWVWFGVLLLTPYEPADSSNTCPALLTSEYLHDKACEESRDWPELVGVIGASVPLAVIGAVLYTSGSVSHRMAEHLAEVNRLESASA